jgi:hypothetical protein
VDPILNPAERTARVLESVRAQRSEDLTSGDLPSHATAADVDDAIAARAEDLEAFPVEASPEQRVAIRKAWIAYIAALVASVERLDADHYGATGTYP